MVFTYCELCLQATKQRKIVSEAWPTELPAKIVLQSRLGVDSGRVWCSLGRHLTGFCSLLGGFWPLLGTSWASLGHFLDALGCLLAALWSFTAAFRLPGPSQASILKGLGTSLTEFWETFKALLTWLLLHLAFRHIMLLKMQCPRFGIYFGFSFLPCSVPVRAKHIRRLPKGCRACRTLIISSSLCLPLRPASRIRLQIPSSKAFPPSLYSFPRTRTDRPANSKIRGESVFGPQNAIF